MSLKLAIWDVDGTIVDSRETISVCMDRAFEIQGLAPPGYAKTRTMVGLGLFEGISELVEPGTDAHVIHALCTSYREAFVAHRSQSGFVEQLYDGALESVARLAADNWLLAIATGKSRRGLEAIFSTHDLEKYFDTIWCADDGPGKPSPFMCREAMSAVGAEADQALMIGDAVHDIRMARAAGIRALGVTWGFGSAAELEAAGAHAVHDCFEELNAELKSFRTVKPQI